MNAEPALSTVDPDHPPNNPIVALPDLKRPSCNESKVLARLDDQITWYNNKSMHCQRWFKGIKITEMLLASVIPLLAGLSAAGFNAVEKSPSYKWIPISTGILGLLVVFAQSLQNLNQYQHNWIAFRSTCEELKHEKYLYEANTAHYQNASDPCRLLADRVESLVSREHARWQSALQTTITAIRPQQNPG
jgi:hypothetical protein